MREMVTCLQNVETEAKRFARSVLDMKRYVTGLSSTRMMCKIESAALSNSGSELAGIVEQLDECQNEIEDRLARIVELNSVIQGNTTMLRSLV
jgi:aerotaxis receptor